MIEITPNLQSGYKLMHDGILALARAERQGIRIDEETLAIKKAHMVRKMERQVKLFKDTHFFKEWQASQRTQVNIFSGEQLQHFLYDVKGYAMPKTTKSGKGSTDEDTLKQLNIPDLDFLFDYGRYKNAFDVLSGFERECRNGFIHPFFNTHIPRTYRSSSSNPNFQNVPIRDEEIGNVCRGVLYARKGHMILESDFKSIEVGISSCYNEDPVLLKYVTDPTTDMHGDMAKQIFKMDVLDESIPSHATLRKAAKNGFVFPQFYGDYFKNNAQSLAVEWGKLPKGKWGIHQGIDLIGWEPKFNNFHLSDHMRSKGIMEFGTENKEGRQWVLTGFLKHLKDIEDDFWGNRFKVYAEWKNQWYNQYLKQGYINMFTGFQCRGPMNKKECCNYPVQGSAFHCLLKCFIEVDRISQEEKWDSKLIGQIHDSMILDVHPAELDHVARTIDYVTSVWLPKQFPWIIVPVKVSMEATEVDKPWSTKHKFKIAA